MSLGFVFYVAEASQAVTTSFISLNCVLVVRGLVFGKFRVSGLGFKGLHHKLRAR